MKIRGRIERLDEARARDRKLRESRECGSHSTIATTKVKLFLKMMGVEQGPMESLMETLARALGIASRELRQLLMAGIDPIYKYLTENGIYEAIEKEKAAGTWPGGC